MVNAMSKGNSFLLVLFLVECLTSGATSYEHNSNARWTIGPAYFPSVEVYAESRLFYWILIMLAATLIWALGKRFANGHAAIRVREVLVLVGIGLALELATTMVSAFFPDRAIHQGLVFESCWLYIFCRLGVWLCLFWILQIASQRLAPTLRARTLKV